jgi:hypothetical protein
MQEITDNEAFKKAIKGLDCSRQRQLAALFVDNVLSLSKDERIPRVIAVAASASPSQDELESALRAVKAAIIDAHTRCGAEGNWEEQASYFVARAAAAAVAPEQKCVADGVAWQTAFNARMARTCVAIDGNNETALKDESEQEFRILNEFLNSNP